MILQKGSFIPTENCSLGPIFIEASSQVLWFDFRRRARSCPIYTVYVVVLVIILCLVDSHPQKVRKLDLSKISCHGNCFWPNWRMAGQVLFNDQDWYKNCILTIMYHCFISSWRITVWNFLYLATNSLFKWCSICYLKFMDTTWYGCWHHIIL